MEDKLSRAEMAVEEWQIQIKALRQKVNKYKTSHNSHFNRLTYEQEKKEWLMVRVRSGTINLKYSMLRDLFAW